MVSNCEFVTFPLVSWVRCGTWLYRFLIFAPLLTLKEFWIVGKPHFSDQLKNIIISCKRVGYYCCCCCIRDPAWERLNSHSLGGAATASIWHPRPLYGQKLPKKLMGSNVNFRIVHFAWRGHASVMVGVCSLPYGKKVECLQKEPQRALVRRLPCELNISCTSTTVESRAKIWYQ